METKEIKVVKEQEFKDLVKTAVNCLAKPDCIMYRLNEKEVLIDYGNENYRLEKNNKELMEN